MEKRGKEKKVIDWVRRNATKIRPATPSQISVELKLIHSTVKSALSRCEDKSLKRAGKGSYYWEADTKEHFTREEFKKMERAIIDAGYDFFEGFLLDAETLKELKKEDFGSYPNVFSLPYEDDIPAHQNEKYISFVATRYGAFKDDPKFRELYLKTIIKMKDELKIIAFG